MDMTRPDAVCLRKVRRVMLAYAIWLYPGVRPPSRKADRHELSRALQACQPRPDLARPVSPGIAAAVERLPPSSLCPAVLSWVTATCVNRHTPAVPAEFAARSRRLGGTLVFTPPCRMVHAQDPRG